MYESEWEDFADLEAELECELTGACGRPREFEGEWEDELEGEEFLGRAWAWLKQPESKQRAFALNAAKNVLRAGGTAGGAALGALAGGAGAPVGGVLGGSLGSGLAALLPDKEWECEGECEDQFDAALPATARQMDQLALAASRARTPQESEAFLGALIPLAMNALPAVASVASKVAPQLIRGVSGLVGSLARSPATRSMVRAVPSIVKRTTVDIARQAARGRPVSGSQAVRSLARNTVRTLGNRHNAASALARCQRSRRLLAARMRRCRC